MNRSRISSAVYFAFVRILVAGYEQSGRSYTVNELAERIQIAHSTAWGWMRGLRDLDLVHIKKWRRAGKIWVACYAWGFKEDDAPRPAPLSQAEHERNYRQRKKQLESNGLDDFVRQRTSDAEEGEKWGLT